MPSETYIEARVSSLNAVLTEEKGMGSGLESCVSGGWRIGAHAGNGAKVARVELFHSLTAGFGLVI